MDLNGYTENEKSQSWPAGAGLKNLKSGKDTTGLGLKL